MHVSAPLHNESRDLLTPPSDSALIEHTAHTELVSSIDHAQTRCGFYGSAREASMAQINAGRVIAGFPRRVVCFEKNGREAWELSGSRSTPTALWETIIIF